MGMICPAPAYAILLLPGKSKVLEAEIANLTSAEVREVAKWAAEHQATLWDKQIEEDAAAGRLDEFIEEALEKHRRGETCRLP